MGLIDMGIVATRRPGFKYTLTCAYTYGELCACGECGWNSGG